ncbi:hypothetical protein D9758_011843 [Tetrapyrgos nigripes]|uniref:Uncharacterized protein n=1 Tax=Tetrapyrgos nigripes TaxID=182062 RepID=A0A8H5CM71_9AGAR|nr:hypothetical protein D9758_011843 [Tetrapyrgos nigripes]
MYPSRLRFQVQGGGMGANGNPSRMMPSNQPNRSNLVMGIAAVVGATAAVYYWGFREVGKENKVKAEARKA